MNPYAIPPLITDILLIFIGAFVFLKNKSSKLNILFSLFSFSMALWLFGYTNMYLSKDASIALRWARIGFLGIIFIPILAYHFIIQLLNLKRKVALSVIYLLSIPAIFFSQTEYIYNGIKIHFWGYYPLAGKFYFIFLLMFGILFTKGVLLLFSRLKKESGIKREQLKYVCLAFGLGTFGVVDYLIKYPMFDIYPFGYICALLFTSLIAYAIIKYRLMDITIAITRAGIFAFVYFFVLGIPFLLAYRYGLWQIAIWITLILATLGPFIFNYLRRQAEAKIQAEERRAQAMLIRASEGMTLVRDLKRLTNLIVYLVSMELKLKNCSIYLLDKQTNQYLRRATRIPSKVLETEPLDKTNPLIQHLHTKKAPFLYEELKIQTSEDEPVLLQMQRLSASAVVPSFIEDFLIGFLVLDRRRDERVLSSQTLNTLQILANQAALAVENCIFIEERGKSLAETFHEQNLRAIGTLGAGIGHQINNRFNAIAVPAQIVSEMIESAQLDETSDQKLKGLLLYSKEAFDSIFRDALRGGRIATSLTHFSRKTEEYILVFLSKIIEEVLNVLSCKFSLEELNLKLELPSDLPPLFGNPSQLDSVFFNLLDNAHDANNKKSEEIRAGRIEIADYQPQVKIKAKVKGKETLITVEDNGIGMTKEQLDKVFVPFYTSKATSEKGTGLGLWIIRQIIEAHRGKIYVESEYLKGATFYILLPLATEEQKRSFQAKEKDV